MRNLKLILAYDGTGYHGWQRQPAKKTLQGVLEAKLGQILAEPVRVWAASRTDAGVHAWTQVVNFTTQRHIPSMGLLRGLNSMLPQDIVIKEVCEVEPSFQARFCAKRKKYVYRILQAPYPSPFERHYAWYIPYPLALEPMQEAAGHLVGTHTFTSFQGSGCGAKNPIRTVYELTLSKSEHILNITIRADGFLRHMVRNIVGTLVEVGRGRLTPEDVGHILAAGDRTLAGPTAPPQGLYLAEVEY